MILLLLLDPAMPEPDIHYMTNKLQFLSNPVGTLLLATDSLSH